MPNKQYEKGARFERKLVNEAREKGLIAARTAGSHSPIDLFTIDVKRREIAFIQAKKGKSGLSRAQVEEFENMSNEYMVKFEVVDIK
jgi:Holliday junction resolvase